MPLKVPGSNIRPFGEGAKPSEVDQWMALSTMEKLGRFPTFEERFSGQPPGLPLDVGSKGGPVIGIQKGTKGMGKDMSFDPEPMPNRALDFLDSSPDAPGEARVQKVKKR